MAGLQNEDAEQASGADRDQPVLSACIHSSATAGPGGSLIAFGVMKPVHLLTVERTFHIERIGLLALHPDFSVPEGFPKQRVETVFVEAPGGARFEAQAQFNISHVNISDPHAPLDARWRVTVSLLNVTPAQAPVGSKLFASPELAAILRLKRNAELGAAPNGGPEEPLGNSGVSGGPPSVS